MKKLSHRLRVVAALLGGYLLFLHWTLLRAVPDAVIHADSGSYLRPALSLLFEHRFDLSPERTPGYPLFLFFMLRVWPSFTTVLWAQHALAIGLALLAGALALKAFKLPPRYALAAAFLSGVFPISLLASHAILTETLYGFLSLLSLVLLFRAEGTGRITDWSLAGLCASAALLVRPVGWALLATVFTTLGLHAVQNKKAPWRSAAAGVVAAIALLLSPAYVLNYARYGVIGLTAFSGVSLFGTTARFLEVEHLPDPAIQRVLVPIYRNSALKENLKDGNWVRYAKNGPAAGIRALFATPAAQDRALRRLAVQAVRDHPFRFLGSQVADFFDFLRHRSAIPDIYLNRDYSFFVARGLWLFRSQFANRPQAETLLKHSPDETRGYLDALAQVRQAPDTQATTALSEAHRLDMYHYQSVLNVLVPLKPFFPLLVWLPFAAFLSGLMLLRDPGRRTPAMILLVYLTAHIVLTNLGGDADPRHGVPLEPLYWILLAAGLHQTAGYFLPGGRLQRPERE